MSKAYGSANGEAAEGAGIVSNAIEESVSRLSEVFVNHKGYVSDKWEQYLRAYEAVFHGFIERQRPVRLLEIGVQNGGSLQIWSTYFPRGSTIVGIDIDPACAGLVTEPNVSIRIGDASDRVALDGMLGNAEFDVIIDDGSHRSDHVVATFNACFGRLSRGGLYIVEDLHCSYHSSFGGGFRLAGSSMEWFKGLADTLNADHFEPDAATRLDSGELQRLRELGREIGRITFFDSLVVVEKLTTEKRQPYRRIITGRKADVVDDPIALEPNVLRKLLLPPAAAGAFTPELLDKLASAREEVGQLRAALTQAEARHADEMRTALVRYEQRMTEAETRRAEKDRQRAAAVTKRELVEKRLAEAEEQSAARGAELANLVARAAQLEAERDEVRRQRDDVLGSTFWRITEPARKVASVLSPALRRQGRRSARVAYWVLTPHRTGKRIAYFQSRRLSRAASPAAAVEPLPTDEWGLAADAEIQESEDPYQKWIREHDALSEADRRDIRVHIGLLREKPLISVIMATYETNEAWLREAIASVRSQLYPYWELCVADDSSCSPHVAAVLTEEAAADARIKWMRRETNGHISEATNTALGLATGSFVALMDHDDLLAEQALYEIAVVLNAHPDADLIFSDEDQIDNAGRRHAPYFKPDWNYDLFLGHNMVNHLGVYRRSVVNQVGRFRVGFEGSQDYDLALRVVAATSPERIHHIPAVLYHWRRLGGTAFSELNLDKCTDVARRAVAEHIHSLGGQAGEAEVLPNPTISRWNRIRWQLPSPPRVSIIVPTRDRSDLLAQCASGVLHRTDYPDVELIIVDNDSVEPETDVLLRGLARDPRVRVLPFAGQFNYSAINNSAVEQATGDVVVLLNNDTVVIAADWLREMVSHLMRPKVGAVGAKLLYADNTVQHAGVVLGIGSFDGGPGVAGHFGLGRTWDDPDYFGQNALTRELSACTGACLALRRAVYQEVGGLDQEHLPVAFNDVDLCIRLRQKGYKIIWTPFAELYHLESASRGPDTVPETAPRFRREAEYMRTRWGTVLDNDPFYSPNFSRADSRFSLASPPLRERPWRNPVSAVSNSKLAPKLSRLEILLAPIPRDGKVLELGPSFSPVAPKSGGWHTKTLDHTTHQGLVKKYAGHPGVDVSRIEDVDFVWRGGDFSDAIPADQRGTFDACIASHVIEHTPDLLSFLNSIEEVLKADGVVALAVPDKRYCFDFFRPLTTTGQVLAAHMECRSRHESARAFDFGAYCVENDGSCAWGQRPVQSLRFMHKFETARRLAQAVRESEDYVDIHAWCFVPASFELILFELAMLSETDLRVERTTPAEGCEFLCWLRRGGKAVVEAMSEAEKADVRLALLKRTMLETRDQVDWLLAGEPGLAAASPAFGAQLADTALRPVAIEKSLRSAEPAAEIDSKATGATDDLARAIPRFVDWMPAAYNGARVFEGDWSSSVPGLSGTGQALLFDDHRILWFERHLGGFQGKQVLELGPLEGGHTYMMTSRGAEVLAIESNSRAWMRCLIVKNHLDLSHATFLLGDFQQYLDRDPPPPRVDFVLASGVLYHMTDPVRLLLGIAGMADSIGLWTHYFDANALDGKEGVQSKFRFEPRLITTPRGRVVRYYDQAYLQALNWSGFCGGSAPGSAWMARDEILDVLGDEGFACETGIEDVGHPNGPAFCVFARRR